MLPVPEKFGRYFLTRRIATGGMAEIYLARLYGAQGFERDVVIKKILPQWSSDRDFISMLIDEAKIAVQLSHPNIVQVYELGREDGIYYIAMEYLDGVDLRRLIHKVSALKQTIPLEISLTIMAEVLDGLAYAHARKNTQGNSLKIIHRDISPQNILLSYDGVVKITDFGIAKAASKSHETVTGVIKGKFAYMSPEQANQMSLDHRSDLFSAAIVFYELLTGERLFYRGSDLETLDRVRRGHVTFSEEKKLPARLKEILLRALAKEREDRYPDAVGFREELLDFTRGLKKKLRREKVASFLNFLFQGEIHQERAEVTKILSQATILLQEETQTAEEIFVKSPENFFPPADPLRKPLQKARIWGAASVILGAVLFFWFSHDKNKTRSPVENSPLVESRQVLPSHSLLEASPIDSPKEKGQKEEVSVDHAENNENEQGFLSVQAIPWGTVVVDGRGRRMETPLKLLPLPLGRHAIRVFYEPDGSVLSSTIHLEAGRQILCVADFRGGRKIRCGG